MRYRVISLMILNDSSDSKQQSKDFITNMAMNFSLHVDIKHLSQSHKIMIRVRNEKQHFTVFNSAALEFKGLISAQAACRNTNKLQLILAYDPQTHDLKHFILPTKKQPIKPPTLILKKNTDTRNKVLEISQLLMIILQDKQSPGTMTSEVTSFYNTLCHSFYGAPRLSLTNIDESPDEESIEADSVTEAEKSKHSRCILQ